MSKYDWLKGGTGREPRLSWSSRTNGNLAELHLAQESGELLTLDALGELTTVDRNGRVSNRIRFEGGVRRVAWSDVGARGAALVGDRQFCWFDQKLEPQIWIDQPEETLAIAVDSHGYYAAVSLIDGTTLVYDATGHRIRRFSTAMPLMSLKFFVRRPALVGVAEHGLLCCLGFDGNLLWKQTLWSSVGDLATTAEGETILLAAFTYGIQVFDGAGRQLGSYQVDGTVTRVATSYAPKYLAAITQEGDFFFLNNQGEVLFQVRLPEPAQALACDSLGPGAIVGLTSGKILRFVWDDPAAA
jgi:hypothetical protein